jgi:hypothetical protein
MNRTAQTKIYLRKYEPINPARSAVQVFSTTSAEKEYCPMATVQVHYVHEIK